MAAAEITAPVRIEPNRCFGLVGFGHTGQALARYLARQGVRLLISDQRAYDQLDRGERELLEACGASYDGGAHSFAFLAEAEALIVSPGIPSRLPLLEAAATAGIPVLGELELAAGRFRSPVIAITGTNGKTTVTGLIGEMLQKAGFQPFVGGHIGTPLASYLLAPERYDLVVLELSSFQLERPGTFAPDTGVLLNLTPDHLDRHGTLEAYAEAKMNLFRNMHPEARAVINGDDPFIRRFLDRSSHRHFLRFGRHGEADALAGIGTVRLRSGEVFEFQGSRLDNLSGSLNAAAALLAVAGLRPGREALLGALKTFLPAAHRMQEVGCVEGVRFIDDSKGTNTGAVLMALEQLGDRVVLIAGGLDKGDDFSLLRQRFGQQVKKLVLLGEAAARMAAVLGDVVELEIVPDLAAAVRAAAAAAMPGDVVLLSPACASFDMFSSYGHRGEVFAREVAALGRQEEIPGRVG